jgi:hypothetical protein
MDKLKLYDILQDTVKLRHNLAEILFEDREVTYWQILKDMFSIRGKKFKLIESYNDISDLEDELVRLIKE